ncbi:Alp7A family actin-like protein [Niallia sp. FSL K6-0077]|uniref:Alp7A family actin-like protein n=1 Tax=Niallia sp. FSL K6-0077 TaxID=2954743 RepID=UPI0030F978E2
MLKIERDNKDFGNSTCNVLSDSYYYELSTAVAEITKEEAEGLFTSTVDSTEDLLDRLLISSVIEGEERYFIVGKLAEKSSKLINVNGKMHDKIESIVPYAMFLAETAYYYKLKSEENLNEDTVDIDRLKMMLPIWLLKKEDKFSTAYNKMTSRFIGEHNVKLLTPGQEVSLTINVKEAKCYTESEVARRALKYKIIKDEKDNIVIKKRNEVIDKFASTEAVFVDIGGGSTDAALLAKGLNAPVQRESLQVIKIEPFLGKLEDLLANKLIQHFSSVKVLEKFIVDNYVSQRYIKVDPNTGDKVDLTKEITAFLKDYAEQLVKIVTGTFNKIADGRELKYVYFGGEAPILVPYIKEYISNTFNDHIADRNHFLLSELLEEDSRELLRPSSRTINIIALDIISLTESEKVVA